MSTNQERDEFLADLARRVGESVEVFALARALSGPPLGSDMVFLLVGATALHLLPTVHEASMFGITVPSKKKTPDPVATDLPRQAIEAFDVLKPQGWWAVLTGPQEVVTVSAQIPEGLAQWQFQLVGGARAFVASWRAAWGLSTTP